MEARYTSHERRPKTVLYTIDVWNVAAFHYGFLSAALIPRISEQTHQIYSQIHTTFRCNQQQKRLLASTVTFLISAQKRVQMSCWEK